MPGKGRTFSPPAGDRKHPGTPRSESADDEARPHLRRRLPGLPQRGRPDPGKFRAGCVRIFLLSFGGSLPAISSGCKKRLPGGDAPDSARRNGARGGTGRARNPFPAEAVAVGRRPVPPSGRANPLPRLLPMVRREEAPGLPPALPSPVTAGMPPLPPFRTGRRPSPAFR